MNKGNKKHPKIWSVTSSSPVSSTTTINGSSVTFNMELEAITAGDRLDTDELFHKYNISTWELDPNENENGLRKYVSEATEEKSTMMVYLTNAYNNLEQLKSSPPLGMSESDLTDMQNSIVIWADYGLEETIP